jgi:hypothetical protein
MSDASDRLLIVLVAVIVAVIWRNEGKRREYVDARLALDKERLDAHDTRAATRAGLVRGAASMVAALTAIAVAYAAIAAIK